MFQFRGFATCVFQTSSGWVAPFGHLRIKGRLHLPAAFRSLPRPSSPPGAKASPIRSYFASMSSDCKSFALKEIFFGRSLGSVFFFALPFFTTPFFPVLSMNFLYAYTHFHRSGRLSLVLYSWKHITANKTASIR